MTVKQRILLFIVSLVMFVFGIATCPLIPGHIVFAPGGAAFTLGLAGIVLSLFVSSSDKY